MRLPWGKRIKSLSNYAIYATLRVCFYFETMMTRFSKPYKKLYRSNRDRMIAGVCGGLAEYFNIDPTIMRLGFAGLLLVGGSALVVYLVIWMIVPLKRN